MPRLLAYVDAQLEESFSHSLQTAEQGQGQLELDVGLTGHLPCGRLLHGGSFLLADMDIAPSTTDEARKEPSLYVRIAACYGTSPPSGSRVVPAACHDLHIAHPTLRVISQVGKVADTVFEAGDVTTRHYTYTGANQRSNGIGLSGDPVIASNGTFLRYRS